MYIYMNASSDIERIPHIYIVCYSIVLYTVFNVTVNEPLITRYDSLQGNICMHSN